MSEIIISCGGTGGHLAPGIALAEALKERGHSSHLLISKKDVDSRLVAAYPQLNFIRTPGVGFSIKPWKLCYFSLQLCWAMVFSLRTLQRLKPDVVVGFGGFLTVGVAMASFVKGCPLVLHEANRKPGRAIRMMSGIARRVYLPEGVHLRSLPPRTMRHAGYPVRKEICKMPKALARKKLGIDVRKKLLLVLGGSQGAHVLNAWAENNFEALAKRGISVLCITGLQRNQALEKEYRSEDGNVSRLYMLPFTTQMAEVLSTADMVVSRAGAGSLAEFIRCRLPAILIPYPSAANNHQMSNARFFEQQGGGVVLPQDHINELQSEVLELMFNEWLLNHLSSNLERLDRNNSIERMVEDLESIRYTGYRNRDG